MDDYPQGEELGYEKQKTLIDVEYKKTKSSRSKNTMFQPFIPRRSMDPIKNENPKDIFKATNDINTILSKNLKSIYDENQLDISQDLPVYQNVSHLIKKNDYSNKLIYQQIFNSTIGRNNYSDFTSLGQPFIAPENNKRSDLSNTTIKNSNIYSQKNMDFINKNKLNIFFEPKKIKNRFNKKSLIHKNYKERYFGSQIRRSNIKKHFKKNYGTDTLEDKEFSKLLDDTTLIQNNPKLYSSVIDKDDASIIRTSKRTNRKNKFKSNISNKFMHYSSDKKSLNSYFNQRYSNMNLNFSNKSNHFKLRSQLKSANHKGIFEPNLENSSMKILSLNEINDEINISLIENRLTRIKKELKNLENNEVNEILNQLKRTKSNEVKDRKAPNLIDANLMQKRKSEFKENSDKKKSISTPIVNSYEDGFQKKYRKIFLSKNLYDSLDDEEEVVEEIKVYNFYMAPNSIAVYILDFFILIASLIEIYYMPLYICLNITDFRIYYNLISSIIFYICDIIYIIDLIAGFFRAYHNFEEVLIKKNVDIFIHYFSGWFFLDLIEAIPIFTLLNQNMKKLTNISMQSIDGNPYIFDFGLNNKYFILTLLKCLKIFKVLSDNKMKNKIYEIFDKSAFLYEWKGVFSSVLISLNTFHFCNCVFIFIGKNEYPGWIIKNNLQDNNFIDIYIAAFYYLMTTLTTVGYGDITANFGLEKIYGIIILIVGTCAYSFILTYISNYIKKNNEKFIEYEKKMNILTEIKHEYPNLGKILYERIKRYLNYNKFENKVNLKYILESLPLSLQNNLIIEIYKPLIQNFQFFKTFENSDFFVKIVTSLKPILSIRGDLLIQEGDVIEDIIFIKNGVLSLEILIDLNSPKKSIEFHLKLTENDYFNNISYNKLNALRTLNTLNTTKTNIFKAATRISHFVSKNYKNKKEIKIIDLRKNEHFGDILMILNEKSPLAVKVKSKKAELFFLQKTEATEISNRYSNIWKRIVNRSLHNMKQIKNLIKKKIFEFVESYNPKLNAELKIKYIEKNNKQKNKTHLYNTNMTNIFNKNNKFQNFDFCETIKEEDEKNSNVKLSKIKKPNDNVNNILKSMVQNQNEKIQLKNVNQNTNRFNNFNNFHFNANKLKEKKITLNENINLDDNKNKKITENKTESNLNSSKNEEEKNDLKDSNKNENFEEREMNINNNFNQVNDMITMIDEKVKNSGNKNQINNFNINIYAPKFEFPINNGNNQKQDFNNYSGDKLNNVNNNNDSYNCNDINNEISLNHELDIDMKINDIQMNNNDKNNNIFYNNSKIKMYKNNNSNINKLFTIKPEEKNESDGKDANKKFEIKSNDNATIKTKSNKETNVNTFSSLNISQSNSFSIKSLYDNINIISKYNFHKNSELREKTKNFILEELNNENKDNKENKETTTEFHSFKTQRFNKLSGSIFPKKIINKNASGENLLFSDDNLPVKRKSFSKIFDNKKRKNNSLIIRKNSFTAIGISKRFSIKKRPIKKNESVAAKDKTFYNKIRRFKTMHKNKMSILPVVNNDKNVNEKINYGKLISKNIENNQKNLNNPESYFEGFFKDIIFNNLDYDDKNIDDKEPKKPDTDIK